MTILYNILIVPLLFVFFHLAGLFNAKIRTAIRGRSVLFEQLTLDIKSWPEDAARIWIHISSMGEYEQGKPVIDEILSRTPNAYVLVTFFSPSGYEHVRESRERVAISYLPFDSRRSVQRFLNLVQPNVGLVVRHDIWPNFQWTMQARGIPSMLIDASISDRRLKDISWLKPLYRNVYSTFSAVCAVSDEHKTRIQKIYSKDSLYTCGDTRYDRVYERATKLLKIKHLVGSELFIKHKCLVAGSTWPSDEKHVLPAIEEALHQDDEFKAVIAPHEISKEHLEHIVTFFQSRNFNVSLLSDFEKENITDFHVLIIDKIGILANLYALGSIAFVGGGFGPGIHNVLEPAAHGCAVFFGPRHKNSPEPGQLLEHSGATFVESTQQTKNMLMSFLKDVSKANSIGNQAKNFVEKNIGASRRTVDVMVKFLL